MKMRKDLRCCAALCPGIALTALFGLLTTVPVARAQYEYPASSQITKDGTAVLIEDYANAPISTVRKEGAYPAKIDMREQLGRVNSARSEPADAATSATRFFVPDENGVLYILDKATRKFTPYLDFGKILPNFINYSGFGAGLVSVTFDPGYAKNGKFYTVHIEKPGDAASTTPTNSATPGLRLAGYSVTNVIEPPVGGVQVEAVLMEWTGTNIRNSTFEGTAREILREGYPFPHHPMGDLLFNPLARPGQPDYGNLYVSIGDGGSGEVPGITHPIPQRLDALPGKILRITPDISLHPSDQLSSNGRYRIPSTGANTNPFVSVEGALGEIYAYGFRNPHRISWDTVTNTFLADTVGLHSWEDVVVVKKGANYGWPEREGPEQPLVDTKHGGRTGGRFDPPVPFPSIDTLIVDRLKEPVTPVYPVADYSHRDGDAIGTGFVYRGKLMPQMTGKYIFTDISTGRVFYTNLDEMLAAGGVRGKVATIHEIQIVYKSPYDATGKGAEKRRMYDIVADAFAHKGGIARENSVLPESTPMVGAGFAPGEKKLDTYGVPYGGGRADVRLSVGGDGEIYMMSKADSMIRKMVSVVTPPPAK